MRTSGERRDQAEEQKWRESIEDQEGSLKVADFRLKARATRTYVQAIIRRKRKAGIVARKDDGNKLYRSGKHEKAIEKYMEAVMGVAIGDSPSEKKDAILTLQVPLLSNLAACMMVKGQHGRGRSLLDEAVSLLEHYGEGEGGETELGIQVHLQYLKVYTRRSKCFIHIGYLNKAISDLKKVLKLIDLCNRLIEDNCGVLVDVNVNNNSDERDKLRSLLALKRKEVQKLMRDAKQRREKDKKFVRAMMSKTISAKKCKEPEHNATAEHEYGGFPDPSTGNNLHSDVAEEENTGLISADVDESEDEDDHTDLFVAHQKLRGANRGVKCFAAGRTRGAKSHQAASRRRSTSDGDTTKKNCIYVLHVTTLYAQALLFWGYV